MTDVDPKTTTEELENRAKRAGNIHGKSNTGNKAPGYATSKHDRKIIVSVTDDNNDNSSEGNKTKKTHNSEIFPLEVRPDWLKEDKMINSLPTLRVANVIAQNQMTIAINKQNELKEEKAN